MADPTESGTLYTYDGYTNKPLRSTDRGNTWTPYNMRIDNVVADPVNTGTLYALSGGDVYRSTDRGGNWDIISGELEDGVQALAVSGSNPAMVFAGTQVSGIYRTQASGMNKSAGVLTLDHMKYCIGESWRLDIAEAPADMAIGLVGISNGVPWKVRDWARTDQNGNFSESGMFGSDGQGLHQLHIEIGGINSNTVSFIVSNCSGTGDWDY